MTWDLFKKEMSKQYIPKSPRDKKAIELYLVQGNSTMAQYEMKFTQLSRIVPHMVADDVEKVKKFQSGLTPYIQERIAPFILEDYSKVHARALVIEKTTPSKATTEQPNSL